MKDKEIVLNTKDIKEASTIKNNPNLKYINIDITKPNREIIKYLLENGQNLLYSESINNQKGYIYIDYNIFRKGEYIIKEIINSIPKDLSTIEKAKYIYIKIGQLIGYDINTIEEKNETINLSNSYLINNLWGSLSLRKANNKTITQIYYYICKLINIDCKIAIINEYGYQKNILNIDNLEIIVDLTQDIPYIQSGFKTRFFGPYNDDEILDKKIGYLKEEYSEKKIETELRNINFNEIDFFKQILLKTQNIINVNNISPIELGIIYNGIFNKYCPTYDISINNLYINSDNKKEHFILISCEGRHYSFNYNQNTFVEINDEDLFQNIQNKKIGIYEEEIIPKANNKSWLKIA